MTPVFLLPDAESLPHLAPADHWMSHWQAEAGEVTVLNWGAGATASFRLYASLQAVPGVRVVAEGRRIAGFAALSERHLDLAVAGALLVVTEDTAPGLLEALETMGDSLWFAPFAFPVTLALAAGLPRGTRRTLEAAARDWGARLVALDPQAGQPVLGRDWAEARALLRQTVALERRSAHAPAAAAR